MNRTFAVIPAAGTSSRMGRPKLLLPLGGRSVLECVIAAVKEAGVDTVLVVVGPHVRELLPVAREAGASVLELDEETADMRTTVQHGLDWLERHCEPSPDDQWLLLPADHPTLDPEIVRAVLQARLDAPDRSIVIPTYRGKRGHPALLTWRHVPSIRAFLPGQGLNTYMRQRADEVLEKPMPSDAVLVDLDTPEDYARLRERFT